MGSGSVHGSEDIFTRKCLIQCKETKEDYFYITYDDLIRLHDNAKKLKKVPYFIVRLKATIRPLAEIYVYGIYRIKNSSYKVSMEKIPSQGCATRQIELQYLGDLDDFMGNSEKFLK
jgi:Holliday junction resolvase